MDFTWAVTGVYIYILPHDACRRHGILYRKKYREVLS
jgi:hypothetical protein